MNTEQILQALSAMSTSAGGGDSSASLDRIRQISRGQADSFQRMTDGSGQRADKSGAAAHPNKDVGPLGMAAATRPVSYEYNNRAIAAGAQTGQRYGVLAQDLEKTPVGKQFVGTDPATGYKAVDTAGLTLANTAAIGQLVREKQQERQSGTDALALLRQQKAESDYRGALANKQAATNRLRELAGVGFSDAEYAGMRGGLPQAPAQRQGTPANQLTGVGFSDAERRRLMGL